MVLLQGKLYLIYLLLHPHPPSLHQMNFLGHEVVQQEVYWEPWAPFPQRCGAQTVLLSLHLWTLYAPPSGKHRTCAGTSDNGTWKIDDLKWNSYKEVIHPDRYHQNACTVKSRLKATAEIRPLENKDHLLDNRALHTVAICFKIKITLQTICPQL